MAREITFVSKTGKVLGQIDTDGTTTITEDWKKQRKEDIKNKEDETTSEDKDKDD